MLRTKARTGMAGLLITAASFGALAAGCSSQVALRPGKTCDGGNIEQCRSACDQNQGRACYRLGWFYEEGQGVGQSHSKAVELYKKACDANMAIACRGLGIMYWQGEDVKRSRKTAIEYFQKACGLGLPEACPTPKMLAEAEGRKSGPSGEFGISVSVGGQGEAKGEAGAEGSGKAEGSGQ